MENIEEKKMLPKTSASQCGANRRYREKMKDNEEYKESLKKAIKDILLIIKKNIMNINEIIND